MTLCKTSQVEAACEAARQWLYADDGCDQAKTDDLERALDIFEDDVAAEDYASALQACRAIAVDRPGMDCAGLEALSRVVDESALESGRRGPGRPKTGRGDWVTLGLQVSPEVAARLKDIPRGRRGQAVDAAVKASLGVSDE